MEWWWVDLGLYEMKRKGRKAENGWKKQAGGSLE